MANQKMPTNGYGKKLPYTPGTGKTIPIPAYKPGSGTAKTLPYRPKRPLTPVTKAARAINSIDTRDVFEKALEYPMVKPRKG